MLGRLGNRPYDGDEQTYTSQDRMAVRIHQDRIYSHKTLRINYTTYDLQRDQDLVTLGTHPDVMVLAQEDDDESDHHPYWYARVIRIFTVRYRYYDPNERPGYSPLLEQMHIIWVRWFGRDFNYPSGWSNRRPNLVGFFPASEDGDEPFGFLDPALIVRGVHMIPAYYHGTTTEILPHSVARNRSKPSQGRARGKSYARPEEPVDPVDKDEDYCLYYVNW